MSPVDPRPLRVVRDSSETRDDSRRNPFVDADSDVNRKHTWGEQWTSHHAELVRYATYLLSGDVHAAEDVAQETAIRLWQHPEVLDDSLPLRSWLRTVARNVVIDRSRRRNARPPEVALSPGVDAVSADEFDDVDSEAAVATMLAGLSPRHRAVVYEVYVRDRPVVDVAADLGIPAGTVKSRCHTALHQLRADPPPLCA